MLVRTWKNATTVTLTFAVASVEKEKPLVGWSEDVEKAWRSLLRKHKLKERKVKKKTPLTKSNSVEVPEKHEEEGTKAAVKQSNSTSDIGRVLLKFRQLEENVNEDKKHDVYSKNYVPKKYSKGSAEYGTPKPGTLTEKRAQKASKHVAREMLYLCEMIEQYGYVSRRTGQTQITFGTLFHIYQFISDKVVGMLLRARKHKMVDFEGEMLFQRRDEEVVITLLLTPEEIKYAIENNKHS